MSSELAQDRRAWSASIRDVVNAVGDAGLFPCLSKLAFIPLYETLVRPCLEYGM